MTVTDIDSARVEDVARWFDMVVRRALSRQDAMDDTRVEAALNAYFGQDWHKPGESWAAYCRKRMSRALAAADDVRQPVAVPEELRQAIATIEYAYDEDRAAHNALAFVRSLIAAEATGAEHTLRRALNALYLEVADDERTRILAEWESILDAFRAKGILAKNGQEPAPVVDEERASTPTQGARK